MGKLRVIKAVVKTEKKLENNMVCLALGFFTPIDDKVNATRNKTMIACRRTSGQITTPPLYIPQNYQHDTETRIIIAGKMTYFALFVPSQSSKRIRKV